MNFRLGPKAKVKMGHIRARNTEWVTTCHIDEIDSIIFYVVQELLIFK